MNYSQQLEEYMYGLDLFNNDTCPSGHIRFGLRCHIYVDATEKVISDLVKCEKPTLLVTKSNMNYWQQLEEYMCGLDCIEFD